MNQSRLKLEHVLYGIALLLALYIRLTGANVIPLTNREADLALQALALARGQAVLVGPHPAYLALTTALMILFSAGNWVARFWPAVMGSLLVLVPALFRGRIGKLPAVLLAFFLALDPGLLAVSRQADSLSMALLFSMLALGLWINQKATLAGIAAGMALLSGPQVWPGLLGLGAAVWITGWFSRKGEPAPQGMDENPQEAVHNEPLSLALEPTGQVNWRRGLAIVAATVFFAGTLFFTIPSGLSAMADSLPAYVRGWVVSERTGMTVGLLLIALLVYELFPLVFGIWGGLQALLRRSARSAAPRRTSPVDRFLLIWFLIALLLALLYPGRAPQDLGWALLPLWALAARQVARQMVIPRYDRLPMFGHMALVVVILGYISMALASVANGSSTNPWEYRVRLAGAVLMLVASTGLIAWGWSRMIALRGVSWGIGVILLIYLVSAGWNSIGLSGRDGAELFASGPRVDDADLLMGTVRDLAQWNRKIVGGPDIVVVGEPSPALRWLLRDVERVRYASQLPTDTSPALVVTAGQPDLALAASYRGQGLILGESAGWSQFKPAEWLKWVIFRSVPVETVQQDRVILWARSDLFPGGAQAGPADGNP